MIKIIGELGINFLGDLEMAKKMIDACNVAGCTHIKVQTRGNLDKCVPDHKKNELKKVPWTDKLVKYIDYKRYIELDEKGYRELKEYTESKNMIFFTSVWDKEAVDFLEKIDNTIVKIPSAHLTNWELLEYAKDKFQYKMLSTGMSTEEEIEKAVKIFNPDLIFHTNSSYPCEEKNLRLGYIKWLKEKYPDKEIGYSGHEYGNGTTLATVPLGVTWIERHVTLDHRGWSSDDSASVEPDGLFKLVRGIRNIELALKEGYVPREVYPEEESKRKSLRG